MSSGQCLCCFPESPFRLVALLKGLMTLWLITYNRRGLGGKLVFPLLLGQCASLFPLERECCIGQGKGRVRAGTGSIYESPTTTSQCWMGGLYNILLEATIPLAALQLSGLASPTVVPTSLSRRLLGSGWVKGGGGERVHYHWCSVS